MPLEERDVRDTVRDLVADLAAGEERYFASWDPLPGGLLAVARRIMAEKTEAKVASERPWFLDAA